MLLFAAMSQAQDSVIPETTQASDASTSLQASSAVVVANDGIEYCSIDIVAHNNNKLSANKAYAMAKEVVEKGVGN